MYQWICEKCGEENRSGQNICRNLACKFVFHGTKEQTVKCAKCKRAPVGNSLYRKGRNTDFPLKRLSATEIYHPDYEPYGAAGRKFLDALKPYIGMYLCQSCHPWNLSLKIDTSFTEPEEVSRQVYARAVTDEMAYDRVAKNIKAKLVKIRNANQEMTDKEELELARRLIHKVKDDEFQVDQIDLELRRIIRGAITSKISFRKNIPMDRIYEKLYRYWRIEEARQRKDMSHLKKVLKEEARRAKELGEELINDARKGPDIFSQIEKLTQIMADKSDEIALREHRINVEAKMGEKYDDRMTILFGRIKKLEVSVTKSNDPDFLAKILPILHRTRNRYSFATEQASRFLTPLAIGYERELVARMQRKFFTHYAPLLSVARNIIFWDIKEDMWKGPDGMTEAQKDQAGYGKYFSLQSYQERVQFGRSGKFQEVTVLGRKSHHHPLAVRCEVCDQFTEDPQVVYGIYAVRRVEALTGSDLPPKVFDFLSREQYLSISKDQRGMIRKMDLVLCENCRKSADYAELEKARNEVAQRKQIEASDKAKLKVEESAKKALLRKYALRDFKIWIEDAVHAAVADLVEIGTVYSAPIIKIEVSQAGQIGEIDMTIVTVPKFGSRLPSSIVHHGCEVKIRSTPATFFRMAFVSNYLSRKEMTKWNRAAKKLGVKLVPFGIKTWNGIIGDLNSVLKTLGVEMPFLPMAYWKGIAALEGLRNVHANFRDLIVKGSAFDLEPMYPYGKPTESELLRLKAIKMDKSRRRSEERRFWDFLRTRGKGGPSPKNTPKINKVPIREDRRGFHKESPMSLLPGSAEAIRQRGNENYEPKVYVDPDPATKELKDFLMLPPPSTGDKGTRHWISVAEDKEFYRQKSASRGQGGKDHEYCKKIQKEADEKFRRMDPKTFQKVKLPPKK